MEGSNSFFNMTANDTQFSCAARNIQGPVEYSFNPYVPLVARCLLVIYYMMVAFFGTVLNCFVLYLVCRYKELHTLSFVFAIQNVVCNIIGSAFLVSTSFVSVLANQWLLGGQMCILIGGLYLLILLLRTLSLNGIVLDRFCSVFFTYSYPRYRVKVMWCYGIAIYFIAAIVVIIFGAGDCYSFAISTWTCRLSSSCSLQCSVLRQLFGFAVFLPITVVPVIMYTALYCKGRKVRKSMRALAKTSGSEIKKEKRDNRATITFFLMFLAFFLVSAPPGVSSTIANSVGHTTGTTDSVWVYIIDLSNNMNILAHVADPIFIIRNKDVREVISQIPWIPWIPFLKVPRNRMPH